MSKRRIGAITLGIMLSLFLASLESTVVATAMPTIVSQLGGLAIYSWVFSAYLLAATTTVPIYGKLSDLYGRRPVYAAAMGLFLAGSLLCARAATMSQLIGFRVVQGIGAGGLIPLAFIIIGDLFDLEQRTRVQGLFSGVWGVSSVVGPLVGGFLVDRASWHWIFYLNLVPGALAFALVWTAWRDREREASVRALPIDFAGAGLLSAAVVALLLGLFEIGSPLSWVLLLLALALFAGLLWVERRAADPILPLSLFRGRLFAVACGHGALAGWAMFGIMAYIPLFVQAVLGTSATQAGATLTPLLLAWVAASIVSSRLLLHVGYRTLALIGMITLTVGASVLALSGEGGGQVLLMANLSVMGIGMGLSVPSFLIAVQSAVKRQALGTATSTLQFCRNIGGTLGVSVMGAALSVRLASALQAAGFDPISVSLDSLLNPIAGPAGSAALEAVLRSALTGGIRSVFLIAFVAAAIGLLVTLLAPKGRVAQLAASAADSPGASIPSTIPGP